MRSIRDYTNGSLGVSQAHEHMVRMMHERAARVASARPEFDPVVAQTVTDLIRSGDYDELLVGRVDAASWGNREDLIERAERSLTARAMFPGAATSKLITDHVALEVEARYPALSDTFQEVLEAFEREWGYRRSYAVEIAPVGARARSEAVYALVREPDWAASRVNDGRPSGLDVREDSRTHRVPHHIAVSLHHGLPLVEFKIWNSSSEERGWATAWLLLQDRIRLIPADTAVTGRDALAAGLLDDLARVAASAIEWQGVREARFRSVFGAPYQRDGMPAPRWRAGAS